MLLDMCKETGIYGVNLIYVHFMINRVPQKDETH